jgi:hypothetical protein
MLDVRRFFAGSIALETQRTSRASAVSEQGLCVYQMNLIYPETDPRRLLRYHVVPGQIEYNGALYCEVKDNQYSETSNRLTRMFSILDFSSLIGPKTNFQLVVQETLDSKSLEAAFYIQTEIAPALSNGLNIKDSYHKALATLNQKMIGVFEVREKVTEVLRLPLLHKQNQTSTEPATINCPLVDYDRYDLCLDDLPGLTHEGEWIFQCLAYHSDTFQVLRGNFAVLYSVLCYHAKGYDKQLTILTRSLPCLIFPPAESLHTFKDVNKVFKILSTLESRPQVLEGNLKKAFNDRRQNTSSKGPWSEIS